jgi:TRAP-type mannitol/chloroaromatic compound transport system permease large subunit
VTIAVFLFSLLGCMAIGMPVAYSLLLCGVALMYHLDIFDAQIIAQNLINGADSFPLMAVPFFMLAGEIMNTGGLSKRIVDVALAQSATSRAASATSPSWRRACSPLCPAPLSPMPPRSPRYWCR